MEKECREWMCIAREGAIEVGFLQRKLIAHYQLNR